MNTIARNCRPLFRRHKELFFIVLFLLCDFFLSGWALVLATLAAVLFVVLPAVPQFRKLDAKGQIAYLKAFIKTPRVQRLGFLLFWIYSLRFFLFSVSSSRLLVFSTPHESEFSSLATIFVWGPRVFAPLAYLGLPLLFYGAAAWLAIVLRSRLKANNSDQDLLKQRKWWTAACQFLFTTAFIGGLLSITINASGPSYMLSNWLLASAMDANIFSDSAFYPQQSMNENRENTETQADAFESSTGDGKFVPVRDSEEEIGADSGGPAAVGVRLAPMLPLAAPNPENLNFVRDFDNFIYCSTSLLAFVLLLQPALKLNSLLTSFSWRVVSAGSVQNWIEAFLEALRLPARSLSFGESHPFWANAGRTLVWISFCYLLLLYLFGICGGPIGEAIHNWMLCSVVDAYLCPSIDPPTWLFDPKLRFFLGSMVALYGAAPLAVTAAVFLPHAGPRRVFINADGLLFSQGPYLSLMGRQFRLWSDMKSFSATLPAGPMSAKADFKIEFHSGGSLRFNQNQVPAQDLKCLLDAIDEFAVHCAVAPETVQIIDSLFESENGGKQKGSRSGSDFSLGKENVKEFKSTIFQPYEPGQLLGAGEIRVIKLLASKALSAVYLGRDQDGRMLTVKQFYLPKQSEETRALEKIMMREYELLSSLDHPGISKVLKYFSCDNSAFLVIEHRPGSDLRAIIEEHGPRSESVVISWAKQICRIMIYLHGCQPPVIHRDLSPDNLVQGHDGQLRLIDFGAAREFLDGISGTMIGKHCYIAPEQLRGQACIKSDIYSFGGSLFYLLTGRDPKALSQSWPSDIIACSDELNRLIGACTAFDQEERPASFAEILKQLDALDKGVRISLKQEQARTLA